MLFGPINLKRIVGTLLVVLLLGACAGGEEEPTPTPTPRPTPTQEPTPEPTPTPPDTPPLEGRWLWNDLSAPTNQCGFEISAAGAFLVAKHPGRNNAWTYTNDGDNPSSSLCVSTGRAFDCDNNVGEVPMEIFGIDAILYIERDVFGVFGTERSGRMSVLSRFACTGGTQCNQLRDFFSLAQLPCDTIIEGDTVLDDG